MVSDVDKALRQIHLVELPTHFLLFHPDSLTTAKLDCSVGVILERLQKGESAREIAQDNIVSLEEVENIRTSLAESLSDLPSAGIESESRDRLPTLYLHVSNACNLACVYCYANGGSYNSAPSMMKEEVALKAVESFMEKFNGLGTITFFGGEPMMNATLVPKVCEYAQTQARSRGISPPRFAVVTNGTMLTESNVDFLARYDFGITVSLDGPQVVNDLLRPTVKGNGSFTKIVDGLQRLSRAGISPNIECTYTARHIEMNITPRALLEHFRNEYGTKSVTLSLVATTPGHDTSIQEYYDRLVPLYRDAIRYSLETLTTDRPIVLFHVGHVVPYLLKREKKAPNQFCYTNLGKQLFAVSSIGAVSPCHMMNDRPAFEMGNIHDPEFTAKEPYAQIQKRFETMSKDEMQCQTCWARHLCFMCVAGVEIETKKLKPIPKHRCDFMKGIIEEILTHLSVLRGDPHGWRRFVGFFGGT